MPQRTLSLFLAVSALSLASATIAVAQTSTEAPASPARNGWEAAQLASPSKGKLVVVTFDQPQRRQTCRIRSITSDKLVCSRAIGGAHSFLPQQVLALILPGDDDLRVKLFVGFNVGLGAAIWGTLVLAATCPACAVATGVAAYFFFASAGVTTFADGRPDRLLYLAPGQQLTGKLRFVEP